jgi:Na+-transporting NADH:ubiquinone oxidoreductase subunit NqrC
MTTFLIILVLSLIIGLFVATKYFGVFTDKDKNGIPDKLEEKVEEVKTKITETTNDVKEAVVEVKERVKRVKQEVADVAKAAKEVVKQSKDVAKAASGETRKGRKPKK